MQWRAPTAHAGTQAHPDQDGFQITRPGDVNVRARVILHLKLLPERFKLIEPLAEVLDMKEDTRTGIVTALWHYIKANGLQDKVDRKIIRPDAKLRPVSDTRFKFMSSNLYHRLSAWNSLHFINCQSF